eukprot:COSAG01_NODE_1735_length_9365_cov_3.816318_6_plen_39_part_00
MPDASRRRGVADTACLMMLLSAWLPAGLHGAWLRIARP